MTMPGSQLGFTLIEVLVTILIVAIGLLGLGALQVNTMNDQFEANQRAYATWLVDDMASRIRANNIQAVAGAYFGTTNVTDCRAAANTTVVRDLCLWNALLAGDHAKTSGDASVGSALDAVGCITAGPAGSDGNVVRVAVAWQGVKSSVSPADTCGQNTFGDEAFRRVVYRDVFLR